MTELSHELQVAIRYAMYAYETYTNAMGRRPSWSGITEEERRAWIHLVLALKDDSEQVQTPPAPAQATMQLRQEAQQSIIAILGRFAGQQPSQEIVNEASQLIRDWIEEKAACAGVLENGESLFDHVAVDAAIVEKDGKPDLRARFYANTDRGKDIVKDLIAEK